MDSDRLVVGEGTVSHYWSMCFADEHKRDRLKLKYISQMWDKSPYWYLWFADRPGVYKLSMIECLADAKWDWRAVFRLSYYPRPEEESFQGLSMLEQICRMSDVFQTKPAEWQENHVGCVCHGGIEHHGTRFADLLQETGVPNAKRAGEIPEDFFWVGKMELLFSESMGTELIWESQDYWRVKMTENYYIRNSEGEPLKVLRKGDVDRDYPGWELTDLFARRFLLGWKDHQGYRQVEETLREQNGLEFFCDGQSLSPRLCPEIRSRLLCCRMNN